jgi:hypothetical protein
VTITVVDAIVIVVVAAGVFIPLALYVLRISEWRK